MSVLSDAIQVLGEERIEEIRAGVTDLLRHVMENRERYARKRGASESESRIQAA